MTGIALSSQPKYGEKWTQAEAEPSGTSDSVTELPSATTPRLPNTLIRCNSVSNQKATNAGCPNVNI